MATVASAESFTRPDSSNLKSKHDLFSRMAAWTTRATGGRWGFLIALGSVVIWALLGPLCGFSQNWQLVINTGTTIVTFLMVFLIQNAQNRESKAIHLKLDELIFAVKHARNEMIDVENLSEEQLDRLGERYTKVAEAHQHKLEECFQEAAAAKQSCEQAKENVREVEDVRKEVEDVRKEVEEVRQKPRAPYMTVK